MTEIMNTYACDSQAETTFPLEQGRIAHKAWMSATLQRRRMSLRTAGLISKEESVRVCVFMAAAYHSIAERDRQQGNMIRQLA